MLSTRSLKKYCVYERCRFCTVLAHARATVRVCGTSASESQRFDVSLSAVPMKSRQQCGLRHQATAPATATHITVERPATVWLACAGSTCGRRDVSAAWRVAGDGWGSAAGPADERWSNSSARSCVHNNRRRRRHMLTVCCEQRNERRRRFSRLYKKIGYWLLNAFVRGIMSRRVAVFMGHIKAFVDRRIATATSATTGRDTTYELMPCKLHAGLTFKCQLTADGHAHVEITLPVIWSPCMQQVSHHHDVTHSWLFVYFNLV